MSKNVEVFASSRLAEQQTPRAFLIDDTLSRASGHGVVEKPVGIVGPNIVVPQRPRPNFGTSMIPI